MSNPATSSSMVMAPSTVVHQPTQKSASTGINQNQARPPALRPINPGSQSSYTKGCNQSYSVQECLPQDAQEYSDESNVNAGPPRVQPPPQYTEHAAMTARPNDPMAYGNDTRNGNPKPAKKGFMHSVGRVIKNSGGPPEGRSDLPSDPRYARGTSTESRLRNERNMYRQEAQELDDLLEHCKAENGRLQADLMNERARLERTMRSADQMQSAMDNRESFLGEQANDEEVCGMFDKLTNDIKTWSTNFSGGSANTLSESDFPDYQRVVPNYTEIGHLNKILTVKKQKRLFVRGWTAYVVCTLLNRSLDLPPVGDLGEDVWLNQAVADNFRCLENQLWLSGERLHNSDRVQNHTEKADRKAISYKSFNDWRAFTAELLGKAALAQGKRPVDEAEIRIKKAASKVMNVVSAWHKSGAIEDLKAHERELHRVLTDAVHFAQFLRRQRALWSIRFPSRPSLPDGMGTPHLMFNPVTMQDQRDDDEGGGEELKNRYVQLIAMPALYKRGNMNGELFESEEAVRLAQVVLVSPS